MMDILETAGEFLVAILTSIGALVLAQHLYGPVLLHPVLALAISVSAGLLAWRSIG